jgi:hypothetical protein
MAVVVVLAVLVAAGVFNSGTSSSSVPDGTPAAYSSAVSAATAEGRVAVGGPWAVVAGIGVGLSSGISQPNAGTFVGSGCTYTAPLGASPTVTVLGTPSNATPGKVATWMFFAKNDSGDVILMMIVNNGNASVAVLVTGCSGVSTFAQEGVINATNVIDSTTVATEFDASGGSTFLANHTSVTQLFVILGSSSSWGSYPVWEASYTTCSLLAVGGTGSFLVAYYYADSGSLLQGPLSTQHTC